MNKLTDNQVQRLIDFVRNTPGLYDKSDADYKKTDVKEECWKEIASKLSADEKACKAAWRCLKDQFVRRLKQHGGRATDEMLRKYKNFDRLFFLKDYYELRNNNDHRSLSESELEETSLISTDITKFFTEFNSTETVPVPDMTPLSSNSSVDRKTKISSRNLHDFETNSTTAPEPEDSANEINEVWVGCSSSTTTKKKKTETNKDEFSGIEENPISTIQTENPDSVEPFFLSIAKSAKSFNLTPVELTTLMMGTTELLHKIISNRQHRINCRSIAKVLKNNKYF